MGLRFRYFLAIIFIAAVLQGCSEPTIDGSSDEAMKQSLNETRDSLSEEKKARFNQAIKTITGESIDFGAVLRGEKSADSVGSELADRLDGKNADQIISDAQQIIVEREAREKEQALIEISELEAKRIEAEKAREALENFVISESRLYKTNDGYIEKPVIEMTVTNNTEKPVARAFFEGTVVSSGRSVPWIEDKFNYEISGGLEPGETAEWALAPNMFSDWAKDVPGDAILLLSTYKIEGPGWEADSRSFTKADAERLENLKSSYQ